MKSHLRFKGIFQLGCLGAALLLTGTCANAQTALPFVTSYAGLPAGGTQTLCTTSIPTYNGATVGDGCLPSQASLNGPSSVAVDSFNNIYISDLGNRLIRVIYRGGAALTATLIAGSPNIPNFTPVPGRIYTLAGSLTGLLGTSGSPKQFFCNHSGTGTVGLDSAGDGCPAVETIFNRAVWRSTAMGTSFLPTSRATKACEWFMPAVRRLRI